MDREVRRLRKNHNKNDKCTYHSSRKVDGKRRYETEEKALSKWLRIRDSAPYTVYQCTGCGWWHRATKRETHNTAASVIDEWQKAIRASEAAKRKEQQQARLQAIKENHAKDHAR